MQVIAGMFEPIALFDLDVDDESVDYLRRLESGPVQAFQFVAPPQNDDDILFDISSTYAPFELELRVVLVEGVAPTFIHDKNHDGRFTAADLRRMGFKVLSNEARLRLVQDLDVLVTETISGRTCPPPSLIYRDLDGNGADGAISCRAREARYAYGAGRSSRIRRRRNWPGRRQRSARARLPVRDQRWSSAAGRRAHCFAAADRSPSQQGFPLRAAGRASGPAPDRGGFLRIALLRRCACELQCLAEVCPPRAGLAQAPACRSQYW